MADNVTVTPGSGATIGADDIGGGVLIQRTKTTWGPDGTANDADVASGKPLPIQVRSATGLIPIGEPTDAKNSATDTTSVAIIPLLKQLSASLQTLATAIKNEDVASADADPGVVINFRETAAPAATVGTDGDYGPPQMYKGHAWVAPPPIVKINATFNRASNTTSYTANDLVNASATGATGAITTWSIPRGGGILRRVDVRHNATGSTSFNNSTFRVWLFDATFTATASQGDNDAFSQPLATAMGFVDVAVTNAGTDLVKGWTNCDIPFVATTISGLVQILNAWTTPTASATFNIDLEYCPS